MSGFEDQDDPRNGPQWRTGKKCVEVGCDESAGTAWSPFWCVRHNIERMRRVDRTFEEALGATRP